MNANELKKVIDTAAAGREEGYRKLFSEFGGIVFSLISRMVGDTADAEMGRVRTGHCGQGRGLCQAHQAGSGLGAGLENPG